MAAKQRSPLSKWTPAPEPWVKAFNAAVSGDGRVQQRKMFGYPAVFAGGNMAAGLHEKGLVLRLAKVDRDELLSVGGKPFEPMPGRVMSGFALAPESFVRRPRSCARGWIDRSSTRHRSRRRKSA